MNYDNYIFDLYGTLIDIHTDEDQPALWKKTADYMKEHFGAKVSGKKLKEEYRRICAEEEAALKKRSGAEHCEIRITWVFAKILKELTKGKYSYKDESLLLPSKELVEEIPQDMLELCVFFRESSRDKLVKYEGVDETLTSLKNAGKKIFLLSNAQRSFTLKELEDTQLTKYFDDIFISSDKLVKKPDKKFMEMLLEKNTLASPKCVMIGNDLTSDVGVAVKSGINSIFLNTYDVTEADMDCELKSLKKKGCKVMPKIVMNGDITKILEGQLK
jgi:putative hydrolase of the HAD superfamily